MIIARKDKDVYWGISDLNVKYLKQGLPIKANFKCFYFTVKMKVKELTSYKMM